MHGNISQDLCEILPKRLPPAVHQTAQPARDREQQHPGLAMSGPQVARLSPRSPSRPPPRRGTRVAVHGLTGLSTCECCAARVWPDKAIARLGGLPMVDRWLIGNRAGRYKFQTPFFRQAEEYGCTRGLSRTRSVGPGCGMFRPFSRPRCSGGVLASRASAGQKRLSARGVEPAGRGSRPGIRPFGVGRMNARAIGAGPRRASRDGLGSWRSRRDLRWQRGSSRCHRTADTDVDIEDPPTKVLPGFRPSGRRPPFKTRSRRFCEQPGAAQAGWCRGMGRVSVNRTGRKPGF